MKKSTRQQAINTFCKQCIYDPHGGNGSWLLQVENCTADNCPLFAYRPITQNTKHIIDRENMAVMSPEELTQHLAKKEIVRKRLQGGNDIKAPEVEYMD